MAELCLMKRFRRNAEYVPDCLCFQPIDRNQRILIMRAAEALELRTKGKGCKSGVLMQSGLRVIHCLLFVFCAVPSGRCCPSYEAIREATGYCKNTISGALSRLETSGFLRITRRIIRTPLGARQTSNAYAFREFGQGERKPEYTHSTATTNLFKNKHIQAHGVEAQPVQLSFTLQRVMQSLAKRRGQPMLRPLVG
jgi:hypothetical protein